MLAFEAPYCLLHRDGVVTLVRGAIERHRRLADAPRPRADRPFVVAMVPFSQLRERGFLVHDGGEEILSLVADEVSTIAPDELGPDFVCTASSPRFGTSDAELVARISAVIDDEIRNGEGSNFLLSRKCFVSLAGFDARAANSIFRRLCRRELGAYLTFCFFDGTRFFVGSSPERHITVDRGGVRLNPICGTLPKASLRSHADLVAFLSDPKEQNELFQVVDEELKMMAKICGVGGEIHGPLLKEMSSVIHTEYLLSGHSRMDPLEAFRLSMFAPTMVGSPLENAARIIHRYEDDSRRWYSSAIMLRRFDPGDPHGESLDSAITIRTMEVGLDGRCILQSGASIVRDSVPEKECEETKAKVMGLLRAIAAAEAEPPLLHRYHDERSQRLLAARNDALSRFWLYEQTLPSERRFGDRSLLIVDNEDEFTFMLRHMFAHIGIPATVRDHDDPALDLGAADLVLVGPGPGDPTSPTDPKMLRVRAIVDELLASGRPFMAVCLGHQIVCHQLGMPIVKRDPPLQGVQADVELWGRREPCGFYNTFLATAPAEPPAGVELATNAEGQVLALRSESFVTFQFHVESVLTTNGLAILRESLEHLLRAR